jgi:hypothetical protein
MTQKISGTCLLGLVSIGLLTSNALADCYAVTSSSCTDSAACTVLSGSYTNTTGKKVKQAEIIATSGDDGKTLASAIVVFTGTVASVYDPSSNTPPSGLNPGGTSTYSISTPFPLAAMDSSLTCVVQSIW